MEIQQSQLLVLGMHRSGTSVVTKLLVKMGAYFGIEGCQTTPNDENPDGFWERKDMRRVCDGLLFASGCDWWKLNRFDINRIAKTSLKHWQNEFQKILSDLNEYPCWVLKEPRMSFVLPLLESFVSFPVVVIAFRNPLEVAMSLEKRNNFPLSFGLALWELYVIESLKFAQNKPTIWVDYNKLIESPEQEMEDIYNSMEQISSGKLKLLSSEELLEVVKPKYKRNSFSQSLENILSDEQINLYSILQQKSCLSPIPTLSQEAKNILKWFEFNRFSHGKINLIKTPAYISSPPTVDINLVAYNDEEHIEEVLDSILLQSYKNFQVTVFDDASQDKTVEIVFKIAQKDSRVNIIRQSVNTGLPANFNTALRYGDSPFLLFKSGNDKIHNNMIEALVDGLLCRDELALAYCRSDVVNNNGDFIKSFPENTYFHTSALQPLDAAKKVMSAYTQASPLWGLYRREYLSLCQNYSWCHGGDHIMMCELSLYGDICLIEDTKIFRLAHEGRSVQDLALLHNQDKVRGLSPYSFSADISFLTPFLSMTLGHINMFRLARVEPDLKIQLMEEAKKIFRARFGQGMLREAEILKNTVIQTLIDFENSPFENLLNDSFINRLRNMIMARQLIIPEYNYWEDLLKLIDSCKSRKKLLLSHFTRQKIENFNDLSKRLNLKEYNLIIFPDWSVDFDLLAQELMRVISVICERQNLANVTLLIDVDEIDPEEANLFVSTLLMSLILEEGKDNMDNLQVSLINDLSLNEWHYLLDKINGKISLTYEKNNKFVNMIKSFII
ncbi:glycosyltransferase [Cyanobacterium aponinum UTEX 3222]|uniref:glycosyltransferase n=1 Tax=Cyanobacterium aponinum TaxID=379064 RepID=UPI002B4BEE2D|nr:glycosyltransferase [Cyanobacterium aponinum]WRL37711.1 glycosyltransferase [Cyanobacterium aponinum UTEX 3221]WRL41818.1 glycosyltransferase [Cyanobacterium aponinum UTEX 3222]